MLDKPSTSNSGFPLYLRKFLKEHSFPYDPSVKDKYSQAKKLRSNVKIISSKIQEYAAQHQDDYQVKLVVSLKVREKDRKGYLKGSYPVQMLDSKTLKRCLGLEKDRQTGEIVNTASPSTIEIIKLFKRIVEEEAKEKQAFNDMLERVTGLYYEYNTHHTNQENRFQKSICRINRDGRSFTKYHNVHGKICETELRTEAIGNNALLLTSKDKDYALIFYLYIGLTYHPPFIQGVYVYSNEREQGNTVANLALFQRIKVEGETEEEKQASKKIIWREFKPERERKQLPPQWQEGESNRLKKLKTVLFEPELPVHRNIQYFLAQRSRPISTLIYNNKPFNFAKARAVEPGPYGERALFYNNTKKLHGDYFLYFNEAFSSVVGKSPIPSRTHDFSTIGKAILKIGEDEKTGVLKAQMIVRKNRKGDYLTYSGLIMNDRLNDGAYLILLLYLEKENERVIKESNRTVTLLFNIINDDKLIGGFNITYSPTNQLGVGLAIAIRQILLPPLKQQNTAESILPILHQTESEQEQKIINFLSHNRQALVTLPENRNLDGYANTPYRGLYQLYSMSEPGKLTLEWLLIYQNGYVVHLNTTKNQFVGMMEKNGHSLNMSLRNKNHSCLEFLCINIDDHQPEQGTFYNGIWTGTSPCKQGIPTSLKVILQFKTQTLPFTHEAMQKLLVQRTTITSINSVKSDLLTKLYIFFTSSDSSSLNFPMNISDRETLYQMIKLAENVQLIDQ